MQFVTVGVKHCRFWTVAGSTLLSKRAILGRDHKMTTMLAVAFGPDGMTLTAAMNGDVWRFKANRVRGKKGGDTREATKACGGLPCPLPGSRQFPVAAHANRQGPQPALLYHGHGV